MSTLRGRYAPAVLTVAALAAAGCGSSSKSTSTSAAKPATTPAAPQTPSTATSTTANSGYTQQVDTAMTPLLHAIQGAKNTPLSASAWDQVAKTAGPARDKVSALKPPAAVASLQPQLVAVLDSIATDAGSARDAIIKHDPAAEKAAGAKVAADGKRLTDLANKFKAAGYPI